MKATEARKKRRWRSYYGAEQKSLHVKLYHDVLENLDKEAAIDGTPRNALINQACEYYVHQLYEERRDAALGRAQGCTPNVDMVNQVTAELTVEAMQYLQHIARGLGCDHNRAATLLLTRAVIEYDTRPFSYI